VKDFISALAAIIGHNRIALTKFIFRVYDITLQGELDRFYVEKILIQAYGELLDKSVAVYQLNNLFGNRKNINLLELEMYSGPIDVLSGWIQAVLRVFVEVPPAQLSALERRYSSALETEEMMARHGIPKSACDQLRQRFYSNCGVSVRAELDLGAWMKWTTAFLPEMLAREVFLVRLGVLKSVWRFVDFAEFCMIFGLENMETKASSLCTSFFQHQLRQQRHVHVEFFKANNSELPEESTPEANEVEQCIERMQLLFNALSVDPVNGLSHMSTTAMAPLRLKLSELEDQMRKNDTGPWLQEYVKILCDFNDLLPGLRCLSITACCLFGVRPVEHWIEKEFVTELQLRRQALAAQNSKQPYGPIGTEWCIICSSWWDSWRMLVGRARQVCVILFIIRYSIRLIVMTVLHRIDA
jgi:hypothetical protein